jgi:RNA polymerase sigma factor (sigma-70 family)
MAAWMAAPPPSLYNRTMEDLSDEDLIARYRQDVNNPAGERCINELFRRYHTRVAKWCYRLAGDRDSAADHAQEIFMKAYRNLHAFRGDAKFSTWIYMIARNHCYDELRTRISRPEHTSEEILTNLSDDRTENVDQVLERMESAESVRTLLEETLDDTERRVMTLHYGEDLTLDAVTRLLGLTNASGAKAYIVSARRKLSGAVRRWNTRQQRETN